MAVLVEGHGDRRMADPFLDRFRVSAESHEECDTCVPEIMEPQAFESSTSCGGLVVTGSATSSHGAARRSRFGQTNSSRSRPSICLASGSSNDAAIGTERRSPVFVSPMCMTPRTSAADWADGDPLPHQIEIADAEGKDSHRGAQPGEGGEPDEQPEVGGARRRTGAMDASVGW